MDTLERLEAKIRTVTREKNEIDDEKETIKRQLATYTRRCEQTEIEVKQLREINDQLQHDLLSKDNKIISINRELREKSQ